MVSEIFAFGDESGVQRNPSYCAVCGYIASPNMWKKFRVKWIAALNENHINEFHAKQFFGRYNGHDSMHTYQKAKRAFLLPN